jgi:hypothetical protein
MLPDLPGWDSLSTVTRFHNWAEMAGIVILAFLVVAEVAAYKYGHRKDDLTEQQQKATDQRHDEDMARLHVEAAKANAVAAQATERAAQVQEDNTQLEIRLEEERKSRIALQSALATPHLTPEQIDKLATAVRGRVPFLVLQYTSDATSLPLAQDIKTAFDRAQVEVNVHFAGQISPKRYGLFVTIPNDEFRFLPDLFSEFGLNPNVTVGPPTQGPTVFVGEKKPPF